MPMKLVRRRFRSLARLVRWWRLQVPVVRQLRATPARARWHLLSLDAPGHLGASWDVWSRLSPREFRIHFPEGDVFVSGPAINGDRGAFSEVFVAECYKTSFADAVVVDVGAHKGYFGAYALLHGARAVFSYEPESGNFTELERAARSFRERGHVWSTVRAAVASHRGEATLYVHRESWSHSLQPPSSDDTVDRVEQVDVVALEDVLREARAQSGRLVVKIDVEGSECVLALGTPREAWADVDELFVEMHSSAPCTTSEIIAHVDMTSIRDDGLLHLGRRGPRRDAEGGAAS